MRGRLNFFPKNSIYCVITYYKNTYTYTVLYRYNIFSLYHPSVK